MAAAFNLPMRSFDCQHVALNYIRSDISLLYIFVMLEWQLHLTYKCSPTTASITLHYINSGTSGSSVQSTNAFLLLPACYISLHLLSLTHNIAFHCCSGSNGSFLQSANAFLLLPVCYITLLLCRHYITSIQARMAAAFNLPMLSYYC